ncbi:siderophore-interacting protein [Solimonas marina]|uniref:Siderophore-interacting protein n=1 Tax=Solimonas marina TaxID=2714601 RepID=A0A970B575_9GAMM|nr:siderophore-interacting protein [Solimonas marina]NKF21245.1 siderophore-interacting protein [Solimonas marina]
MSLSASAPERGDRKPQRVRHEIRFRHLQVREVQHLTPHLLRVTLAGADLAGFYSPGFDDHVKLFFPDDHGVLKVPTMGPNGPDFGGPRPPMRDYTPRHYDAAAGSLQIDFALHEAGPATRWAEQAKPGDSLGVGGPRGSFIIPTDFDWHLLVGDDTALPAIGRRLAELPAGARAVVLIEVDGPDDQIELPSAADVSLSWVHRRGAEAGDPAPLADALRRRALPTGDYYAWVAAEARVAKALRQQLIAEHGAQPQWMRAAAYWRHGDAAVHENIED